MAEKKLIIEVLSLVEYFRDSFGRIAKKQHLTVSEPTEHYVVTLITDYARTEALFEVTPQGSYRAPLLIELLTRALEEEGSREREMHLKHLADVALFTVGCLSQSLTRKLVGADYYTSMGSRAYTSLAEGARSKPHTTLRPVFQELATKFVPVSDALGELTEEGRTGASSDMLRFYELWLSTGSERARVKLNEAGIDPVCVKSSRVQ